MLASGIAFVFHRFNPRARTGRDPHRRGGKGVRYLFQSTRPYGARQNDAFGDQSLYSFQSTRPYGARPAVTPAVLGGYLFQSTRPYGARLHGSDTPCCSFEFQSTRPYGARPDAPLSRGGNHMVSIHAPVRGATPTSPPSSARQERFNPRARTGRDRIARAAYRRALDVSIHAPVRGATAQKRQHLLRERFQSTRPYGARPDSSVACPSMTCFNPRARTGRDIMHLAAI